MGLRCNCSVPLPNSTPCNDNDACTSGETCQNGTCRNPTSTVTCTASDQCHKAGTCDAATGMCSNPTKPNGSGCNDNNACTTNDACSNGTCVGGPPPSCDDHNVCTTDSCNPATGCVHTNNTAPCSDGDACTTNDTCSGGTCVGGPAPNCDDGNVCTTDSCDPATGCVHTNNTAPCSDGNACTTNDTCSGGTCVGGPPPSCDDHNVCTTDSCNPASGCTHMNNTLPCDDANACTFPDACSGGECTGVTTAACKGTGGGFINPLTGEVSGTATLLIERGSDPGGKANFGFVVQLSGGQVVTTAPTGNLTYIDHGAGVSVKATSVDSLIIIGTDAMFTGMAQVNGEPGKRFEVEAHDGGEPGSEPVTGPDTFSITIFQGNDDIGYLAAGPLIGGNIQIH